VNTTDPQSRIMVNASRGVVQGYNAQAAATTKHIVLAAEVTVTSNDQPHLVPMATAVTENLAEAGFDCGLGHSLLMPGTGAQLTAQPTSVRTC
jgi:hypothetical protein